MYLNAEMYISEFDEENKALIESIKQTAPRGLGKFTPKNLSFEIAYWRKANAIHGWFVKHVQDGLDECQTRHVSLEQLQKLKDICEKVLADISLAPELLPATRGFFFGAYDYDEWYVSDLEHTLDKLSKILDNPNAKKWHITYRASW
jgi:hypothetical protein